MGPVRFGLILWCCLVVCKALSAGSGQAVSAGLADRGSAAGVFVVGGGVTDGGVQPRGVVVLARDLQLGPQDRRFGDRIQVRPLALGGAVEGLDPGLGGRGGGAPASAGRSRRGPRTGGSRRFMGEPLSETASSRGETP